MVYESVYIKACVFIITVNNILLRTNVLTSKK